MATAAQTNYAGMTVNPTYDVVKDFAPIVRVAAVPTMSWSPIRRSASAISKS